MLNSSSNIYNQVRWIPVQNAEGQVTQIHLRDLFLNSAQYIDFATDSIPEKSALQHFVNFIGMAFLRKNNHSNKQDNLSEFMTNIVQYLDEYADHFQLAGPDFCFLQRPHFKKLKENKKASLSALLPESENGNNGCFFTKALDEYPKKMSLKEVIFALLQGHLFSLGGTGGGFVGEKKNFTDTLAARPLSAFIKEENLQKTFYKNILFYFYCIEDRLSSENQIPAIWECPNNGDSIFETQEKFLQEHQAFEKFGYERMFEVLWEKDEKTNEFYAQHVRKAQGIAKGEEIETNYPVLITKIAEDKKKISVNVNVKANTDRAVWRDLESIVQKFSLLGKLDDRRFLKKDMNVEVLALYTDQAKIEGSIRSNFILSKNLFQKEKIKCIKNCLEKIENGAQNLKFTFKSTCEKILSINGKKSDKNYIENILNHSTCFEIYWNNIGFYFLNNTLKNIGREEDDMEKIEREISKEISFSKKRAIRKFIQDFPDKMNKFKLVGCLYKEFDYVNNRAQ